MTHLVLVATVAVLGAAVPEAEQTVATLVPEPKQISFGDGAWVLPMGHQCVIHIGEKAGEPQAYAAKRLARDIERRFGRKVSVSRSDALPKDAGLVFVLGTKTGNPLVATYAEARSLPLEPASFGEGYTDDDRRGLDGYVIDTFEADGVKVVVVGGMNERGVVYGADTLFQLLRRKDDDLELVRAAIRDWASIPWRGSVSSLTPEAEDDPDHEARVRARLNFLDTRFPHGRWLSAGGLKKEQYEAFKRRVTEAHRRGLLVYAHVISGAKGRYPCERIAGEFEKLLDLGADGMWLAYDDMGGGSDPVGTAQKLMALAKKRGLRGRQIGHTPTRGGTQVTGDYHSLGTKSAGHAHFLAQVPEMKEALYWITTPPSAKNHELATAAGLVQGKFAWWHNWPRYRKTMTHGSYVGASRYEGGRAAYYGIVPLSRGWRDPKPKKMRNAKDIICGVWLNNRTGGKQPLFMQNVLGFWAWCPEKDDYAATCRRTYDIVFGPGMGKTVAEYDAALRVLSDCFSPPHLADGADPAHVRKLIHVMEKSLQQIEAPAKEKTLLDAARLERLYLDPMRAVPLCARGIVAVGRRPPASLERMQSRMFHLLDTADTAAARRVLSGTKAEMQPHLDLMAKRLADYTPAVRYVAQWQAPLSGLDYWIEAASRGRAARLKAGERDAAQMPKRFEQIVTGDYEALLKPAATPPSGKALTRITGADWRWSTKPPSWRGRWGIGRYDRDGRTFTALAFPSRTRSHAGQFAEARAQLAVPAIEGRLLLDVFVNDTSRGTPHRRYRYLTLWVNGRRAFEEDSAVSREGNEWFTVDVTDIAKGAEGLDLRFRVEDERGVVNWQMVTFVGPAQLREEK